MGEVMRKHLCSGPSPERSWNLLAKFVPSAWRAVQDVIDFAQRLVQRETNGPHRGRRHATPMRALAERRHQAADAFHELSEILCVGFPGLVLGESGIKLVDGAAIRLEIGLASVGNGVDLSSV